jgi:hypothetical protein
MPYLVGSVFVLILVGLFTGLLGFATDYWIRFEYEDVYGNRVEEFRGLWRSCANSVDNLSVEIYSYCFTFETQSK